MLFVGTLVIGGEWLACKETTWRSKEIEYVDIVSDLVAEVSFRAVVKFPHRLVVGPMGCRGEVGWVPNFVWVA